jgi:hypothetical protein
MKRRHEGALMYLARTAIHDLGPGVVSALVLVALGVMLGAAFHGNP